MDTSFILEQLKAERDRLDQAISALEGGSIAPRRGRPPGGKKRGITAEGRKRLSEMMKKRWAARRKAAKNAA